jgi:hypothetical protein
MAVKTIKLRVPILKEGVAIAAVLTLVGFFSLHLYYPQLGILGNALNGTIWFTDACPEQSAFSDLIPTSPICGLTLHFRWVLIASVLIIAASWYFETKRIHH